MKLGARLLLLVLIAALPILGIQLQASLDGRQQRRAALAEQALQLARLAAAQQDQFIEGARYLLTAAAHLPEVQNLDPTGCSAKLGDLRQQFPAIAGLGAVRPDGVQFCSSIEPVAGVDISDRSYFQEAMRTKSLAVSGYIVGRVTGRPHLNFAYPAIDEAGEIRAVVVLAFGLDRVSESFLNASLPPRATISLIDGDGVLLARAPAAPNWIGKVFRDPGVAEVVVRRREGTVEGVGLDGVHRLYGFAPLLASGDLFAVVGLPWEETAREINRLFWRELTVTGLAFVLAALAALVAGTVWIRRPIRGIQRAVDRMAHGDLATRTRIDPQASPELRALGEDFNQMVAALEARQRALQASEARYRAVVETAADGIITINAAGIIEFVNPEVERLFGHTRDELIGQNVSVLMPEPDRSRHDTYIERYLRTGEARIIGIGREVTGLRKDGSEFPMFLSIGAFELDGKRFFTGIVRDITERKRFEQHQTLLMAELDHRAKNLLAAIQAMVSLTRSDSGSVPDYADTLIGRLHAMARAHDLLARERWQGARLHELIKAEFAPYLGADSEALEIDGEDVRLNPRAAQTLSLALHELTTNAAKYGALSAPDGRVTIRSSIERSSPDRVLVLSWVESGGPPVAPPERRGFGSVVIERGIAHDLEGSTHLEYAPEGLCCEIRFPLR